MEESLQNNRDTGMSDTWIDVAFCLYLEWLQEDHWE